MSTSSHGLRKGRPTGEVVWWQAMARMQFCEACTAVVV